MTHRLRLEFADSIRVKNDLRLVAGHLGHWDAATTLRVYTASPRRRRGDGGDGHD